MKKKLPYIISVVFALIAVVFAGLWIHEQHGKTELMELLCESSVQQSYEHFTAYEQSEADEEYWYGVAEYNSFMKAYILLCDGTQQPNRIKLNKAYGSMVLKAENVQENMEQLLDALTLFSKDIHDPNAITRLTEFTNVIEHD